MYCKDCRHYKSVRDRGTSDHGSCDNPRFVKSYHHTFGPDPNYPLHPDEVCVPPDGVLVECDEGWGFYVGPDFGCVHWKPRG